MPSAARRVAPILVSLVLAVALGSCSTTAADAPPPTTAAGAAPAQGSAAPRPQFARDLAAYQGLGAWIDVYDYAPAYQDAGRSPSLTPADLDDMARRGVKTVFLQAARWDERSPNVIVDDALIGALLHHAHELGLRVVGWYLPRFADVDDDIARTMRIHDFRAGDDRFDGLAVDIEYTEGEPDPALRNDALVRYSHRLRELVTDEPIGAVVLTAVHLEVINPAFWPDFPYPALVELYDVWMPMAYWTMRTQQYRDGYLYAKESVDRLRADLGRPDAPVAPIGGISDEATLPEITAFAHALADMGAVGGSFYDWNTMSPEKQSLVRDLFTSGEAATLPAPAPFVYHAPPPTTTTTTTTEPAPAPAPPGDAPPA